MWPRASATSLPSDGVFSTLTTALRSLARLLLVLCVLGAALSAPLATAQNAPARSDRPGGKIVLGVLGDPVRFQGLTGQRSLSRLLIVGWGQGLSSGSSFADLLGTMGSIPMFGINPGGAISPLQIARGSGDAYLVALSRALSEWNRPVYVRPLAEMNGHWNEYCAFDTDGSSRGPRYSTAAFRRAFARIALLARGGPAHELDAKLRRLGEPGVAGDLPRTQARIVWNPQGYGSPDIPANSAQAYFPGNAYVDVVANDLYDQGFKAAWDDNDALYAAHPSKPFAIAEWGLWGIDDPAYVERMAAFVKSHRRVELLSYFSSKPGSLWDLATKPRSRAVYRRVITPLGG